MLSWDRVWARVSKRRDFLGKNQEDYRYILIGKQFALTSGQIVTATPIEFAVGAIILDIAMGLNYVAAVTQLIRDLSAVRFGLDYSGASGSIVTGGRINAAAIFGPDGERQFPPAEIVVPPNGTLAVAVENRSTSLVDVDLAFHCMVPRI